MMQEDRPLRGRPKSRIRPVSIVLAAVSIAGLTTVATSTTATAVDGRTVSARRAVARRCFDALAAGQPGVDGFATKADATGLLRARLQGGGGDWDLAVFQVATGKLVAASAGFRSNELAEGFVAAGDQLRVQACRNDGDERTAKVTVEVIGVPAPAAGQPAQVAQVVHVALSKREDRRRLEDLGLDVTEHTDASGVEVVTRGQADLNKLQKAGFTYTVEIDDLAAHLNANRQADITYAAATPASALPSGRTSYRHLYDYNQEMKDLARRYPKLVRLLTLNHPTIDGRDVHGIEIATNPDNISDGKPVFLNMGVHHAREWPAGESTMEWAYDLLQGFGKNARTTDLVKATRNIIVPLVNPDGFNVSREATPLGDFSPFDYEMKRKNCRSTDAPVALQGGVCQDNPGGRLRGTDPNRNYAGFWGGAGASVQWFSDIYRGSAPFSEPETQNVRELVSTRQVTNLITNHTYSNLVNRPPGVLDNRPSLEDPLYEALGAKMTAHNSYTNQPGWALYETTGTTEDWSYWNTGGFGFTFEIGPDDFHPPFENGVVAEYLGVAPAAGAGKGGNREAYFAMLENAASASAHATITGTVPEEYRLRLHKEFQTPTSPIWQNDLGTVITAPLAITDTLDTTYKSKDGGPFSWAVNPSTRPYVAGRYGRDAQGPKQGDIALANPAGTPAEYTDIDPLAGPHEEVPFTVKGLPEFDNARLTVHIEWTSPDTDWDLYVYNAAGQIVASSATGGTNQENAFLLDPPAGEYRAVIVNFAQIPGQAFDDWTNGKASFLSPLPITYGIKETWTLTCEKPNGAIVAVRSIIVDRGASYDVGNLCGRSLRDVKEQERKDGDRRKVNPTP
jgi:hypothetical protein